MEEKIKVIDEKLYMAIRLFRLFCEKYKVNAERGNNLFNSYEIWDYIDRAYDYLHLNGDESAVDDISEIMINRGALL